MATKSITTYEHTCDLCGAKHDEDDLVSVHARDTRSPHLAGQNLKADICKDCQAKPISELLAWFAEQRN